VELAEELVIAVLAQRPDREFGGLAARIALDARPISRASSGVLSALVMKRARPKHIGLGSSGGALVMRISRPSTSNIQLASRRSQISAVCVKSSSQSIRILPALPPRLASATSANELFRFVLDIIVETHSQSKF
jgi:hypothetical protein